MTESIQTTRAFLETLNAIEKDWGQWVDELKICEQEIRDILHEIELTKFDACRGYYLCKQLQDVRQRRRHIKETMEVNSHLRDFIDSNKQLKISLYKTLVSMEKTEENQRQRMYTPRVRMDLSLAEKLG